MYTLHESMPHIRFSGILQRKSCDCEEEVMSGQGTLTERQGINHLEGILINTEQALPYIKFADKRVSWDGEIELYPSKADLETKNMVGKIPVQIKSETHAFKEKTSINSSVNTNDLINYRNDGGCIYFVIHVCEGKQAQIFYNSLLPSDINKILKQKSKRISLKRFPSDKESIIALLYSFIDNRKKHTSSENCVFLVDNVTPEQLKHIDSFQFSFQDIGTNPFATIIDMPTYVYAKPKVGPLIPFEKINIVELTIGFNYIDVLFDGKKYYDQAYMTKTKESETFVLGKGFTFHRDGKFHFQPTGSLFERIIDVEFFLDLCKKPNKELRIGKFVSGFVNEGIGKHIIAESENYLARLMAVKKALEYFGVFCDLDYDSMNENDCKQMDALLASSQGSTYDQYPFPAFSFCNFVQCSNICIAVYVKKSDDKYILHDLFKSDSFHVKLINSNDGVENDASLFIFLKREHLTKLSNINYDIIKQSITSMKYAPLYAENVNLFLLEVLHVYDETHNPKLLDFALCVSKWLTDNENIPTYSLNYLQIVKRLRQLTNEEINLLVSIKTSMGAEFPEIALGACILLESYLEAEKLWAELANDEYITEIQTDFVSFPIFKLWKEHRPAPLL